VKEKSKYIIQFKGLSEGSHTFEFNIDSTFFGYYNYSDIQEGDLVAGITLVKRSGHMELTVSIKGKVMVTCDRCLEDFSLQTEFNGKMFVKFSDVMENEQDDEIIVLSTNESELNLGHYLYESICLSLPYRKVHPGKLNDEDGCNLEMINKLEQHIVTREAENKETDPRWDRLKNIKFN
jgi:uncharacterized metal-binding protein YceD (DUF177 family)